MVLTGMNLTALTRKKAKTYKALSLFFHSLAKQISQYDCNIFDALNGTAKDVDGKNLSFPKVLLKTKNGRELREHWSEAVWNDVNLAAVDKDDIFRIAEMEKRLSESTAANFSEACKLLAERFGEKTEKIESGRARNEKLIYTVSVLGAVTVFILLV